ncbi:MAG: hypothetical protein QN172_04335, partial [Armatimonadota bacterium]|nr:hypothetical protein [Armatimonadota bacterium]
MRILASLLGALLAAIPVAAQGMIEVLDARVAELDDETGIWLLLGDPVWIRRGEAEVRAPRIRYDRDRRRVTAEGGAELLRPAERLTASRLDYHLGAQWLEATGDVTVSREAEAGTLVVQAPYLRADLRAHRAEA